MITSQDIREKTFEKAKFGGYTMNEVDDFLDELADELAVSQKETIVLKGKMKVLVDKIQEYRESEDAMHMALVSAQKIARDLEDEAQTKADAILAEAQAKADALISEAQAQADATLAAANEEAAAITGDLRAQREAEELRLQKAQSAASEYINTVLALTERERDYISSLRDADFSGAIVTPAPAEKKAIAAPADIAEEAEEFAEEAEEIAEETVEDASEAIEEAVEAEEEFAEEPEAVAEEPDFFAIGSQFNEAAAPAPKRPAVEPNDEPDYFKAFEDAVFGETKEAEPVLPEEDDDAPMFRF